MCKASPSPDTVNKFEGLLFPPFQAVLSKEVAEFLPYVFQILALLLDLRPPEGPGTCRVVLDVVCVCVSALLRFCASASLRLCLCVFVIAASSHTPMSTHSQHHSDSQAKKCRCRQRTKRF